MKATMTMNVRLTVDQTRVPLWRLKLLGYCAQLLFVPIEPHIGPVPTFRRADGDVLCDLADITPDIHTRHTLRVIAQKIHASLPVL